MKQLHDTLFVNIDKMNQHNHGNVQKQCVSVMQEMKLQRQKMLKQAVSAWIRLNLCKHCRISCSMIVKFNV